MGLASDCCSCNNLKKSVYFEPIDNKSKDNRTKENIIPEKKNTTNFNKNGSLIVNAESFQPFELKMDIQPQQTDEFEDMFKQL